MTGPIDQTVLDLLRKSAAGPALDRPVDAVLADMGLGPLPQLPAQISMPELPPLPALDLSLLTKPITDLASSFGTGQFGADAGPDPSQVFSQISSVLQTSMQLGLSAVQVAMTLWQGMAATEASNKAAEAQRDGAAIAGQSAGTAAGTATATTSVFTGATLMAAIVAKYMASVAAATPFLTTGAGQVFLLAATTETLAEATAVTVKTRTELSAESAKMMATGEKVPVTNAPKNVDPMQVVSQLMQILPTLAGAVSSGAQSVARLQETLHPAKSIAEHDRADSAIRSGGHGSPGGAVVGGGALGVAGTPAPPLTPYSGTKAAAGSLGGSAGTSGTAPSSAANGSTTRNSGSAMPMGGGMAGAGLARGGESSTTDGARADLINADHGNEVVGAIEGVSLPVIGTAERVSEPVSGDSPDKALTL
ncbi:hypothetical protein [Nocardia sp. NBC_01329]|uniref:hypothetical protein n=1 Tax=Nocardia sp. NBC_01329 TaxID=2903594 RepID=UPI002E11C057|nr:hypothetical protein OG405_11715 [Nocardia sp. NBC_01329]